MESVGQGQMLFGYHTPGNSGAQHGVHELIGCLRFDEPLNLKHARSQTRNDSGMLGERLFQKLAVTVVVFQCPDLLHLAKALKSTVIQLIHVSEVRVCDNNIRQSLDVPKPMGYPVTFQHTSANVSVIESTLSATQGDSS